MDRDQALEHLRAAGAEFQAVRASLETSREQVRAAVVDALRAGVPQAEVIRLTGYARENVRKIARAAGIEPS